MCKTAILLALSTSLLMLFSWRASSEWLKSMSILAYLDKMQNLIPQLFLEAWTDKCVETYRHKYGVRVRVASQALRWLSWSRATHHSHFTPFMLDLANWTVTLEFPSFTAVKFYMPVKFHMPVRSYMPGVPLVPFGTIPVFMNSLRVPFKVSVRSRSSEIWLRKAITSKIIQVRGQICQSCLYEKFYYQQIPKFSSGL